MERVGLLIIPAFGMFVPDLFSSSLSSFCIPSLFSYFYIIYSSTMTSQHTGKFTWGVGPQQVSQYMDHNGPNLAEMLGHPFRRKRKSLTL